MGNRPSARLRPIETPLVGDVKASGGSTFGYGWFERTYGLGAINIEWTTDGLRSITVWAESSATNQRFSMLCASSKAGLWFRLMDDEYLTAIDVGITKGRVGSVRFHTNLRQSQWFGSKTESVRRLSPPPGYYIHMIHGHCSDSTCKNVGAFCVPLAQRVDRPSGCVYVGDSAQIGAAAMDQDSSNWFTVKPERVRAIVVRIDSPPAWICLLSPNDYSLDLASRNAPLGDGDCLLVLAEDERLTVFRAVVGEDQTIASVQFVTNRRTTQWFGAIPPADAVIETRSVADEPQATHIGGVSGMTGVKGIKAMCVSYYYRRSK